MQHIHPAQTYGLKFRIKNTTIALLSDTRYFKGLINFYKSDILIVCVAFMQMRQGIDHLCLADAKELIRLIKPKKAILTHFGMTMLAAKPHLLAESLTKEVGIEVRAAYDGMTLNFP
jgi:phosphoribosyl 1,2-cyclic phosphodiesterase